MKHNGKELLKLDPVTDSFSIRNGLSLFVQESKHSPIEKKIVLSFRVRGVTIWENNQQVFLGVNAKVFREFEPNELEERLKRTVELEEQKRKKEEENRNLERYYLESRGCTPNGNRMTNFDLAKWLAKGNGLVKYDKSNTTQCSHVYKSDEHESFVETGTKIFPFMIKQWMEPILE